MQIALERPPTRLEAFVPEPGEQLAAARKNAGYTRQEDLALAIGLGCSQQNVSNWERSKWPVPDDYIVRVAELLGVTEERVEELNAEIRGLRKHTVRHYRRGAVAVREVIDEWLDQIAGDKSLTSAARAALLLFPRFIQDTNIPEAGVSRNALLRLAEVTEDNLDEVWMEVLTSGYVHAIGKGVYRLAVKQ